MGLIINSVGDLLRLRHSLISEFGELPVNLKIKSDYIFDKMDDVANIYLEFNSDFDITKCNNLTIYGIAIERKTKVKEL